MLFGGGIAAISAALVKKQVFANCFNNYRGRLRNYVVA